MTQPRNRYLPDSNLMIAALSPWHDNHLAAVTEINRRDTSMQQMVLAGQSLAEAYSVLTRIPVDKRLLPQDALHGIRETFVRHGEIVSLDPQEYLAVLMSLPGRGISGGRVYDALIAECARKAGVDELVTFNHRHFEGLVPGLRVVVPST